MMERGARVIGMAAALVVAAFVLVLIALPVPSSRSWSVAIGTAYIVAGAAVLLAPRAWAGGAAVMTAVITGLFALVAFGNSPVDGLILLAATLVEAGSAWALLKQRDSPPRPEDR
jgi:membrane protein implicated in regulation of membrane protease activity